MKHFGRRGYTWEFPGLNNQLYVVSHQRRCGPGGTLTPRHLREQPAGSSNKAAWPGAQSLGVKVTAAERTFTSLHSRTKGEGPARKTNSHGRRDPDCNPNSVLCVFFFDLSAATRAHESVFKSIIPAMSPR